MKALLAVGVEPRLALLGYDVVAQWDKCPLRLPDYLKKMQMCDFGSRVRVGMCEGKGKIHSRTDHVGPKGE